MLEAVRVKPKLQWKSQDIRDARNVEWLLRKAVGNKWSQPERGTWATNGKAIGTGLPKPLDLASHHQYAWV
jgi:hypothetical protein